MKLTRFKASGLHGYLDFDIAFDSRLTLMTGINGSGKTTILNCIQALITPNLSSLQNLRYYRIELYLEADSGDSLILSADQKDNIVELSSGETRDKFMYAKYIADPALPSYRQIEGETEHFRDLMATSTSHPVMKAIESIPTPMFLGLDRRAKLAADERRPGAIYRPRATVRRTGRGMLGTSVNEAEDIAVDAFRDAQISAATVGDQLQRQLILNLLTPSSSGFGELSLPTSADKREIERLRNDLTLFPAIFRLPPKEVFTIIEPFLDKVAGSVSNLPTDGIVQDYIDENSKTPDNINNLLAWSNLREQLKRITVISRMVSSYNERRTRALKPIERYKALVNGFLEDSGKEIDFNQDRRTIDVKIEGVREGKDLSALSSGEAQIFVILTNLAFGAASKGENLFIIDEPELSLHVRWQEMFVDSVLEANQSTQFVMATHSPSIILERLGNCIDVVGVRRKSRRRD